MAGSYHRADSKVTASLLLLLPITAVNILETMPSQRLHFVLATNVTHYEAAISPSSCPHIEPCHRMVAAVCPNFSLYKILALHHHQICISFLPNRYVSSFSKVFPTAAEF